MKKSDIFNVVNSISISSIQYTSHKRNLEKISSLFINIELYRELSYLEQITFQKYITPIFSTNNEIREMIKLYCSNRNTAHFGFCLEENEPSSIVANDASSEIPLPTILFFTALLLEYEKNDFQELLYSDFPVGIEYIDLSENVMTHLEEVLEHFKEMEEKKITDGYHVRKDTARKITNTQKRVLQLHDIENEYTTNLDLLTKSLDLACNETLLLISILQKLEVVLARELQHIFSQVIENLQGAIKKFSDLPLDYKYKTYINSKTHIDKLIATIEKSVSEINNESAKSKHTDYSNASHAKYLYTLDSNSELPKEFPFNMHRKKPKSK